MGLYEKLVNKAVTGIYAKKLERDMQGMVDSGRLSQDDVDRAVSEFKSDCNRARPTAQKRRMPDCCSCCRYFSWNECWYFYEGNPGFVRHSYDSFDYHGQTRSVDYPDESICGRFERDIDK